MWNRKLVVVVLLIAAVTGGLIFLFVNEPLRAHAADAPASVAQPNAEQPQGVPQNAPAEAAGDSVQIVGAFIAPTQAAITFKTGGRLAQINVQEGAQVKKGDTLATVDTTELDLAVKQAQAALSGAQARLNQVKTPATDADISAAQGAVQAAQKNYDKLAAGANKNDLAAAQAALDAAQKNYARVQAGPTADDLAALKAQMDNAQAALAQAQAAYDKIGGASNPNIALAPQTKSLQQATNNYNAALAAYDTARNHPTAAELAAALGQVQAAQAARARLTPDAAQLAGAASQLQFAQAALARLQPTTDAVAAAQSAVDQAQAALDLAQQQVKNATLTAPFDGTVLVQTPRVGEMVGPTTPVVVLADLSHLQFVANVDQLLLGQLKPGETVTLVPDAFKDKTLTGKIARVGWLANSVSGVITVPVTMDVDASDVPVRPGLSATAQIQITNP